MLRDPPRRVKLPRMAAIFPPRAVSAAKPCYYMTMAMS
jgi:hypothetical protein